MKITGNLPKGLLDRLLSKIAKEKDEFLLTLIKIRRKSLSVFRKCEQTLSLIYINYYK